MDLEKKYKELFELYKKGELIDKEPINVKYDFKYDNNFIPYPSLTDKNFNKILYEKKEFNRNKSIREDLSDFDKASSQKCSQTTFNVDRFQKIVKTFLSPLTPYNGLLLYCGTGVGKTCSAISIAEQYHNVYQKRVLVILSSTLVDNFKKQIFDITKYNIKENEANLCVGTKYPDMVIDRQIIDPKILESRVNTIIKERYKFMGYKELAIFMDKLEELANQQQRDPSKKMLAYIEKIKEHFSDRLIIIDEAHNLRVPGETGKKMISEAFLKLMNYVENVKLLLLTATPMFNESTEIVWMMNLLLTNDRRPLLKKADLFTTDGDITIDGKLKLIEACRGYVSFMRGENPFSFPFRIFPSLNNKSDPNIMSSYPKHDIYGTKIKKGIEFLEIIKSNMSEYQKQVYDIFKSKISLDGDIIEAEDDDDDSNNNNDLKNTMQVLNIVYPYSDKVINKENRKKTYGRGGFENCFITNKKKIEYKKEIKTEFGEFLSYDLINNYAPKIKTVIDYIIKSKGIVFIYSRYYPAGLIPLAIALEHIGLVKYSPNGNIAGNIKVDNKFGNKKYKYIVLSRRNELSPNNDLEIAAAKSNSNIEGEVIKVIIVSKIGTEGIDFKRIREVHLLEPWFNLNRAEQIIGRGVRNCSHALLPKEKRNVTIYFHANCYSNDEESADLRTYRVAENKQKRIIEVESILKETAIDCNLNKNILLYPVKDIKINFNIETSQGKVLKYEVGDKDYTFICGFKKCEVKCNPELPKKIIIDESTYDDEFIIDDISLYKKYIAQIYKKTGLFYTYEELLKQLKNQYTYIEEDIYSLALEDMVYIQYPVYVNNKYGYLIFRGNKYIFQYYSIKDIRISMDERKDILQKQLRLKLDASTLAKEVKKTVEPLIKVEDKRNLIDIFTKDYIREKQIFLDIIFDSKISEISDENIIKIKDYLYSIDKLTFLEKNLKVFLDTYYKLLKITKRKEKKPIIINDLNDYLNSHNQSILDSIVDRLNSENLIKVYDYMHKHSDNELNPLFMNSIKLWMIKDTHFFNPNNKLLYFISDKIKLSTPTDRSKEIDEAYNVLKEYHSIDKRESKIKGFMKQNKDKIEFKIRDNDKQVGSVCGTSHLINNLFDKVKDTDASLLKKYNLKYKKTQLCNILEILYRKNKLFDRKKI
jgi:superfamily II DNA or RNA helicase